MYDQDEDIFMNKFSIFAMLKDGYQLYPFNLKTILI